MNKVKLKNNDLVDITPDEEATMKVLADLIIDKYLAMTPEERKKFSEKIEAEKKAKINP